MPHSVTFNAIVREEQLGGNNTSIAVAANLSHHTTAQEKMPPLPVLLATASIEHDSGAKGTTRAQGRRGGEGPHTPHRQGHLFMRGPSTPPLPLLLGRGEGLKLIK